MIQHWHSDIELIFAIAFSDSDLLRCFSTLFTIVCLPWRWCAISFTNVAHGSLCTFLAVSCAHIFLPSTLLWFLLCSFISISDKPLSFHQVGKQYHYSIYAVLSCFLFFSSYPVALWLLFEYTVLYIQTLYSV